MSEEQTLSPLDNMSGMQLLQAALLGAAVGLFTWGAGWALETYVYEAILCQGEFIRCAEAAPYAWGTATVLGAGVGLYGLVKFAAFRPLLIALAAAVSLWGLAGMTMTLPMYQAVIAFMLLYLLAYAVFAWVARTRHFLLTVVILVVLVVAARFALLA